MVTWDPAKRAVNLRKHGIDLSVAESFDFDLAVIGEDRDQRHEQRFRAIGPCSAGLCFLVYTFGPDDKPHAISLRRVSPAERRLFLRSFGSEA